MIFAVVLGLLFISVDCSLRKLDGKLPMINGKGMPLFVDLDVTKFNRQLNDIVSKDILDEIKDRFHKYVDSNNFTKLLQNNSRGEIKNMSTHMVKNIFKQFVESDKFKEELQLHSDKIVKGVSNNFTSSIEFRKMVQDESKREVDDLNKRTKKEIDDLNTVIEDLKKQTNKKTQSLENLIMAQSSISVQKGQCSDIKARTPSATTGIYHIQPDTSSEVFAVFCDMSTDEGGWTVFQQRLDGSVDFYRNWNDYRTGFGNLNGEFWLGNDKLHALTSSGKHKLKIVLGDWDGASRYAEYSSFSIGSEASNYRLNVSGYSGNAGDSMKYNNGNAFSTKDRDNDKYGGENCAVHAVGAWWYNSCTHSNLNGEYLKGKHNKSDYRRGVHWYYWKGGKYSLKQSKMMLRRA